MKRKIIISGKKVHDVEYKPFLLARAISHGIERYYGDNITIDKETQGVEILVEGPEERVTGFIEAISKERPENAEVDETTEEEYSGFVMPMDQYIHFLPTVQLSKIATMGGRMLDKQDSMLHKQDDHIAITKEGFESVAQELKGFKSCMKR